MAIRFQNYQAGLGTLPWEQGFRIVDTDPNNPSFDIQDGMLRQGPTLSGAYQYWHANRIPLDFRPAGRGLAATWRLRVRQSSFSAKTGYAGWTASFFDQHGHAVMVFIAADRVVLHRDEKDRQPVVVHLDTTDAVHHYQLVIDDGDCQLLVDGKQILRSRLGGATAAKSRANRVYFGDWTTHAGSKTELHQFLYAASAKLEFRPSSRQPVAEPRDQPPSLILHYPLDEQRADGAVWDESDHGHNATANVSSPVTAGRIGRAYQFSGQGESIRREFDMQSGLHPTVWQGAIVDSYLVDCSLEQVSVVPISTNANVIVLIFTPGQRFDV